MSRSEGVAWPRRQTKQVEIGGVPVGGGAPISIQSMAKSDTEDAEAVLAEVRECATAGADIMRVAVPRTAALEGFERICAKSPVPIVADIHFDYRLAVAAAERGASKLRINPGNIGDDERLGRVVGAAKAADIPIRIGVNAGSLERDLLAAHGSPTPQACAESALRSVDRMVSLGFEDLVVSIKASDVYTTVEANRLFADQSELAMHIGITEAGTKQGGTVKSAAGICVLLYEGIGDTIRVSLTGPAVDEVGVARDILRVMGRRKGPELISCPTCGRCKVDLASLVDGVEELLSDVSEDLVVAVMGCEVNGPGEAKQADVGLAAGKGRVALFRKGEVVRTVPYGQALVELKKEIDKVLG